MSRSRPGVCNVHAIGVWQDRCWGRCGTVDSHRADAAELNVAASVSGCAVIGQIAVEAIFSVTRGGIEVGRSADDRVVVCQVLRDCGCICVGT